jgi:hypothetical protein
MFKKLLSRQKASKAVRWTELPPMAADDEKVAGSVLMVPRAVDPERKAAFKEVVAREVSEPNSFVFFEVIAKRSKVTGTCHSTQPRVGA